MPFSFSFVSVRSKLLRSPLRKASGCLSSLFIRGLRSSLHVQAMHAITDEAYYLAAENPNEDCIQFAAIRRRDGVLRRIIGGNVGDA